MLAMRVRRRSCGCSEGTGRRDEPRNPSMSFRQRCCFEAFNGLAPRAWEELNVQPQSSAGLWSFLLLAVLCAPSLAASPADQRAAAITQLEAVDRQFSAKSYAAAL